MSVENQIRDFPYDVESLILTENATDQFWMCPSGSKSLKISKLCHSHRSNALSINFLINRKRDPDPKI